MNGASSEPAVNAIFLPLRSAGLLMPLSFGTSRPMSFWRMKPAIAFTGSPLERAIAIGASDAWPTSYSPLPTICTVATDPLPSSTVTSRPYLANSPFCDARWIAACAAPRGPVEPHRDAVGR